MRRLLPFLLLLVLLPGVAQAASEHQFRDHSFGFSLRYPSGWTLQRSIGPSKQLSLVQKGHSQHAITVTILGWHAVKNLTASLHTVKRYVGAYRHVAWSRSKLGKSTALVAVLRPETEGGVGITEGIYLSQWKGKIYQVQITSYTAHPPRTIGAFPAVYRQILTTWRFIK